jgi:hypothetical protein
LFHAVAVGDGGVLPDGSVAPDGGLDAGPATYQGDITIDDIKFTPY